MERVHALTEARLTKKLTLEKVAEIVGVDTSTVGRWEKQDAQAAYTAMRAAWPGEKKIRDLQDYAVHW